MSLLGAVPRQPDWKIFKRKTKKIFRTHRKYLVIVITAGCWLLVLARRGLQCTGQNIASNCVHLLWGGACQHWRQLVTRDIMSRLFRDMSIMSGDDADANVFHHVWLFIDGDEEVARILLSGSFRTSRNLARWILNMNFKIVFRIGLSILSIYRFQSIVL